MYFVFTIELNLLCPVLGSRHCTRAYIETVDPARRSSMSQVRQGSVGFNSSEEEPPTSPFPFLLYTYSMVLAQHALYDSMLTGQCHKIFNIYFCLFKTHYQGEQAKSVLQIFCKM